MSSHSTLETGPFETTFALRLDCKHFVTIALLILLVLTTVTLLFVCFGLRDVRVHLRHTHWDRSCGLCGGESVRVCGYMWRHCANLLCRMAHISHVYISWLPSLLQAALRVQVHSIQDHPSASCVSWRWLSHLHPVQLVFLVVILFHRENACGGDISDFQHSFPQWWLIRWERPLRGQGETAVLMDGMGRTVPSMTFYCSHVRLLVVFFSAHHGRENSCRH